MSSIEVYVIVEGQAEQTFIRDVLAPEMGHKGIFIHSALIGKPGHKGGNIFFHRALADIGMFLKQRSNTYISTMFDFFRIEPDWPGNEEVLQMISNGTSLSAIEKAEKLEEVTFNEILNRFSDYNPEQRFIPYIEMHEFEAILYSDASVLASNIGVNESEIQDILDECGEPEEINDGPETAPSKRLITLNPSYRKVAMGKAISEAIGIQIIRQRCPHFHDWLNKIEQLVEGENG